MAVANSTVAALRFGYGFRPGEAPPSGPEDLIEQARQGADAGPLVAFDETQDRALKVQEYRKNRRADSGSDDRKKKRRELAQASRDDGTLLLLQRALSPYGFFERLTAFWANHFSVSARKVTDRVLLPAFEIEAIRPRVMGSFADMLVASTQHPVMLAYLDQPQSFGPNSPAGTRANRGLNENLAREILELHTLGVDAPYSQDDVREFAKLLTGYGVEKSSQAFRFFPKRAEPGTKTVLGQTYGGARPSADDAEAFLRDVARHPATAQHIARKLAAHFCADEPADDLVAHLEQAFRDSDGDLPAVYEALVEHPAPWEQFGQKVKQPIDLIISSWRALDLGGGGEKQNNKLGRDAIRGLNDMGQPLFKAPGPNGWSDAATDWITPQGLASRIKYVSELAQSVTEQVEIDPRRFADQALADALRPETKFAVGGSPERWEGVALALASPEFNRR